MKVLYVTLYPLYPLKHGGMIRAAKIFERLETFCDAHHLSIFCPVHHPNFRHEGHQVLLNHEAYDDLAVRQGKRPDVHFHELLTDEQEQDIRNHLNSFAPDTIVFEQPWVWPVFKQWLDSSPFNPKIVYSSQNFELDLAEDADRDIVRELEYDLVQAADSIVCVTNQDKAHYIKMGGKGIFVCPNGSDPLPAVADYQKEYSYWSDRFNDKKVVVFVGSAHQPNVDGFMNLVGPALGYLPPDTVLVVVGEVYKLIEADYKFRIYRSINMERLVFTGVVDDRHMNALLSVAEVVLVPVTTGGGSNLKVAQALVSGKKVISTSFGLRGFEQFRNTPLMNKADDEQSFKSSIVSMLHGNTDTTEQAGESDVDYSVLYWHNTLQAIEDSIKFTKDLI